MRILKQARLITLAILCGTVVSSCNYSDIASADRLVGWAIYAIDHTDMAKAVYDGLADAVRGLGVPVRLGEFQAHMVVASDNDGPVTLLIDSGKEF